MKEIIIGLDISTTCTGVTILKEERKGGNHIVHTVFPVSFSGIDKDDLTRKCDLLKSKIRNALNGHEPKCIIIEDYVKKFSGGKSSAHTIQILAHFSGMVKYMLHDLFPRTEIRYENVNTVRKDLGIVLPKKEKGMSTYTHTRLKKAHIIEWALQNEGALLKRIFSKTRNGNWTRETEDMADSYVMAKWMAENV